MKKPTCAMWDKDYSNQWKAWIKAEIEDNQFKNIDHCMQCIMKKANGRVNPGIVRHLYEESLK